MSYRGGGWTKFEPFTNWTKESGIGHNVTPGSLEKNESGHVLGVTDSSGSWITSTDPLPAFDEFIIQHTVPQTGGGGSLLD